MNTVACVQKVTVSSTEPTGRAQQTADGCSFVFTPQTQEWHRSTNLTLATKANKCNS